MCRSLTELRGSVMSSVAPKMPRAHATIRWREAGTQQTRVRRRQRRVLTETASLCPRIPATHFPPSDTSHTPTILSCPPVTSHLPSSEAVIARIAPRCPPSPSRTGVLFMDVRSNRRISPDFVEMNVLPSRVIATPVGTFFVVLSRVLEAEAVL